ncbi:MAG TPA: SDR family oxidoreductase [Gaiellaceae bacterium]
MPRVVHEQRPSPIASSASRSVSAVSRSNTPITVPGKRRPRAVAADWAPYGVNVNAIAPGVFLTDPNRRWFDECPELKETIESMVPMGRLGEPAEIAPLALYLASDASSFMTGAVIVIDGGYTLW